VQKCLFLRSYHKIPYVVTTNFYTIITNYLSASYTQYLKPFQRYIAVFIFPSKTNIMKQSMVLLGFGTYKDVDLESLGNFILNCMTGNAHFPTPTPTLAIVLAALQQFSAAILLAKNGDKVKIEDRKAKRKLFAQQLRKLGTYVNLISDGDRAMQKTSGFPLNTVEAAPTDELTPVTGVRAIPGKNSGEVLVRYNKVPAAVSYEIDFAESPVQNDTWKMERETLIKHLLKGLTRGKEYCIRVRAVGKGGETIVSETITIMVV
jgi:hypothetical protein